MEGYSGCLFQVINTIAELGGPIYGSQSVFSPLLYILMCKQVREHIAGCVPDKLKTMCCTPGAPTNTPALNNVNNGRDKTVGTKAGIQSPKQNSGATVENKVDPKCHEENNNNKSSKNNDVYKNNCSKLCTTGTVKLQMTPLQEVVQADA